MLGGSGTVLSVSFTGHHHHDHDHDHHHDHHHHHHTEGVSWKLIQRGFFPTWKYSLPSGAIVDAIDDDDDFHNFDGDHHNLHDYDHRLVLVRKRAFSSGDLPLTLCQVPILNHSTH